MSDDEIERVKQVNIDTAFEVLEQVQRNTLKTAMKMTEPLEKEVTEQVHDLAGVVADVLVLLRDHLSCHDCRVVDHTHDTGEFAAGVEQVYDGVVDRVDT